MARLAAGIHTTAFENRYRCRDGSWKWLQWTASPLPGRREIYAIARDVTRQKSLEEEILATLDRERERVGSELHDGLCQNLAGIAALCATLARKLAPAAVPESAAARELGQMLGAAIQHAHDLARGVVPLHLDETGLVAALTEFCRNTAALFAITCQFRRPPRSPKLGATLKSHLYRIAQEAMNNAIAHGRASRVDVLLALRQDRGTLTIKDDGVSLGHPVHRHRGLGLHTMAYRARQIGASFALQPRVPHGTVATFMFPLPPAAPKSSPHARKKNQTQTAAKNPDSPRR